MITNQLVRYFNFSFFDMEYDRSYLPKTPFFKILFDFFLKLIKFFFVDLKGLSFFPSFDNKILFYGLSVNNYHSMSPIYENIAFPKVYYSTQALPVGGVKSFPRFIPALISVFYIPKFTLFYFSQGKEVRDSIQYSGTEVLFTYGYFVYFSLLFRLNKPIAVIESNHDVSHPRILVYFSEKYNIPSFHVMHACEPYSASKIIESYALTEGDDSKNKYINAGTDPKKILTIGMPKFDSFLNKINSERKVRTIGFAVNGTEDYSVITRDVKYLSSLHPEIKIIFRAHPMQYTHFYKKKLNVLLEELKGTNVTLSNPITEGPFQYLTRVDCVIAGETSLHLEAVLLNVYPIYYDNKGQFTDYYGFVKNGLVHKAGNVEEIGKIIDEIKDNRPIVRQKAKYYVSTIDTEYDGKSTKLALEVIEDKLQESIHLKVRQ
jgi:hypothetical protein